MSPPPRAAVDNFIDEVVDAFRNEKEAIFNSKKFYKIISDGRNYPRFVYRFDNLQNDPPAQEYFLWVLSEFQDQLIDGKEGALLKADYAQWNANRAGALSVASFVAFWKLLEGAGASGVGSAATAGAATNSVGALGSLAVFAISPVMAAGLAALAFGGAAMGLGYADYRLRKNSLQSDRAVRAVQKFTRALEKHTAKE